jgi:hypothetical protein
MTQGSFLRLPTKQALVFLGGTSGGILARGKRRKAEKSPKNRGNWLIPKTNADRGFSCFGFDVMDLMLKRKIFAAEYF